MSRHRSKLLHTAIALALLVMSMSTVWWSSLSASATSALISTASATCPTPGNNACITNSPTVALTLSGADQTVSFNLVYTLNNSVPGNWHVTITASQFVAASTPLPTAALTNVTAVATTSASCSGSTCPQNSIGYPVNLVAGTAVTFYDNTAGGSHGVGTYTLQAKITLLVPGNTYAGTYTCTITIAFISGSP
jgi:hypothetical protein